MNTWIHSLFSLSGVLLLSLGGSLAARRFRKSPVVFYLLFGVVFANLLFRSEESAKIFEPLANLGIVFLLFTIGLELSVERLRRAGKIILSSALGQIGITGLILSLVFFFFNQGIVVSLFLGFGLSMSSTALVGKLLQQKAEDTSLTGEITLSSLVLQDLVSVGLVTLLTFFSTSASSGSLFFLFLQKAIVVLVSFIFLSFVLQSVFRRFRLNREELSILVFAVVFLLMAIFLNFGIPETTAGFLIGLILSRRAEQAEIFVQVRVFRDVLLVLFFFFLGTYLNHLTITLVLAALLLSVLVMFVKFAVSWLTNLYLGMHQKTAFWVAFDLMEVGEFAFIIVTMMQRTGMLNGSLGQLFLLVIIWSLLLFSLIYPQKAAIYRGYKSKILNRLPFLARWSVLKNQNLAYNQLNYQDHIVLCGYGRVGSYIGHGLLLSNIPLVVIETNADRIQKLQQKGVKAIYGDATERDILDYAEVDKAKFLIVSVPNSEEQERIITQARKLNPHLQIITRTHLSSELRHFKALGVQLIFQPEFEAALSMLKRILKIYNLDKNEIKTKISYLKMEHGSEG